MPKPPGVYVSAFTCERVLKEEESVISAIRLVDTFNVIKPPESMTADGVPIQGAIEVMAVVIFKSIAPCDFPADLTVVNPAGESRHLNQMAVHLKGGVHGHSLLLQLVLTVKTEGLYQLIVSVEGEAVQSLPLLVKFVKPEAEPVAGKTQKLVQAP